MKKSSIKSNPILWKRIVENIKSKSAYGTAAGQWSARKAQAAVKEYKKKEENILVEANQKLH